MANQNNFWEFAIPFILLAMQFGLQPTINQKFVSRDVSNSSLIIATEMIKISLSTAMIFAYTTSDIRTTIFKGLSLKESLIRAGIPALLYSVQNWLILSATGSISPLTLSLMNQTKTLSAALFSYILSGKTQSNMQLVALSGLFVGASLIIQTERGDDRANKSNANASREALSGLLAVAGASLLSGISSAITEIVLAKAVAPQAPKSVSSLIFSIELALFGIGSLLIGGFLGVNPDAKLLNNFFHNWTLATILPSFTSASGGILVGLVTQKAGGVAKGVSLVAGICLATVVEALIGKRSFTSTHFIAVLVVAVSMLVYFTNPPKGKEQSIQTRDTVVESKKIQ